MIAACDRVLAWTNDATKIIPGHGLLATPADLRAYRAMLARVRERVAQAIAKGTAQEAFLAARPLADLEPEWGDGFLESDAFLRIVWADLLAREQPLARGPVTR